MTPTMLEEAREAIHRAEYRLQFMSSHWWGLEAIWWLRLADEFAVEELVFNCACSTRWNMMTGELSDARPCWQHARPLVHHWREACDRWTRASIAGQPRIVNVNAIPPPTGPKVTSIETPRTSRLDRLSAEELDRLGLQRKGR